MCHSFTITCKWSKSSCRGLAAYLGKGVRHSAMSSHHLDDVFWLAKLQWAAVLGLGCKASCPICCMPDREWQGNSTGTPQSWEMALPLSIWHAATSWMILAGYICPMGHRLPTSGLVAVIYLYMKHNYLWFKGIKLNNAQISLCKRDKASGSVLTRAACGLLGLSKSQHWSCWSELAWWRMPPLWSGCHSPARTEARKKWVTVTTSAPPFSHPVQHGPLICWSRSCTFS